MIVLLPLSIEVYWYDSTKGSYDGAEICELACTGLFIQNNLGNVWQRKPINVYRDDRLAIMKNKLACTFGR